jgi:hypothetical protein
VHNRLGFELARKKEEAWCLRKQGAVENIFLDETTSVAYK